MNYHVPRRKIRFVGGECSPFGYYLELPSMKIDVCRWLIGEPHAWAKRPRMKRRAQRRVAGFTRSGARR